MCLNRPHDTRVCEIVNQWFWKARGKRFGKNISGWRLLFRDAVWTLDRLQVNVSDRGAGRRAGERSDSQSQTDAINGRHRFDPADR